MNRERVKKLIDCYGADTDRWPQKELAAAIRLLDASPELIAYQDEARTLDKLLTGHSVAMITDTNVLASRIMDNLPQQSRPSKTGYIRYASAAAIALVFATTWLLQPTTSDIPFSEPTEIAQTEFEQWAWEETFDQTPMAMIDYEEPTDELSFMEI
ncbi:MAG: hypothetical protein OEX83_09780 [Gammaproteobacteria bacterium]|nr:hypothetical protein [Gammaproteobacteria bacterium]